MANKKALDQREKMEASSSDSEEDCTKESRKNMKLMKKMKGDLAVSGKGEGEIEWQRDSDVQHKKWGGDFSFGSPSGLAIRGGVGYESRSEKKSVKGKAKFSF